MTLQDQFNAAYWLSLPTPVQALNGYDPAARLALVESLITQGYASSLLNEIAVWGYDPYTVLAFASSLGYTWLPDVVQKPIGAVGQYAAPGWPPMAGSLGTYPTTPPPGTIIVWPMVQLTTSTSTPTFVTDLLASWYPRFTPLPPVPPTPVVSDPVGNAIAPGSTMFLNAAGANETSFPNGSMYTDQRGTFVHIVNQTPFGAESYWSLV